MSQQSIELRSYQERTIERLMSWLGEHHDGVPIVSVPTGGGKSVIIAELVRRLWALWPDHRPRTVVIVPSKELAEQNAAKLRAMLPTSLRVGYYSASMGEKSPDADVIVATIGSVYKAAHLLGDIKCVVIDECHRVNNADVGQYRQFLTELSERCTYRCVGYTATEYRGDGSWLTTGKKPFFTGIACKVKMRELLDAGYLSPLVVPHESIKTRINTSGVRTTSGDFNVSELVEAVGVDLEKVADEAVLLAADRKKWIAFTPAVATADRFCELLFEHGINAAVVCGETPADVRADRIEAFRRGELRCLVTVLALAVGFDVPDIDCIIWVRPTKSPVLYVQGAGRGLRIAEGKTDCLWLDFTETTQTHGPIDTVTGRQKGGGQDTGAPVKHCPECGEAVPISIMTCPACGTDFPAPPKKGAELSFAPILTKSVTMQHDTIATFRLHKKKGNPDSVRVDYFENMRVVASEWVCFEHEGYARKKAEEWWNRRFGGVSEVLPMPETSAQALDILTNYYPKNATHVVTVAYGDKYPNITSVECDAWMPPRTAQHA